MRVGPWILVPSAGYCSMRVVVGGDPQNVADRVAFIEKTGRVRVRPFSADDHENWRSVARGRGASCDERTAEEQGIYGYYRPVRDACDVLLRAMGYELEEATS